MVNVRRKVFPALDGVGSMRTQFIGLAEILPALRWRKQEAGKECDTATRGHGDTGKTPTTAKIDSRRVTASNKGGR